MPQDSFVPIAVRDFADSLPSLGLGEERFRTMCIHRDACPQVGNMSGFKKLFLFLSYYNCCCKVNQGPKNVLSLNLGGGQETIHLLFIFLHVYLLLIELKKNLLLQYLALFWN